jgi:hypothetical protein
MALAALGPARVRCRFGGGGTEDLGVVRGGAECALSGWCPALASCGFQTLLWQVLSAASSD